MEKFFSSELLKLLVLLSNLEVKGALCDIGGHMGCITQRKKEKAERKEVEQGYQTKERK